IDSTHAPLSSTPSLLIDGTSTASTIGPTRVADRALGPSLHQFGIANPLPDPRLKLHDANGALLASNDNWQSDASQAALITGYGLAPPNNLESAIAIMPSSRSVHRDRHRQEQPDWYRFNRDLRRTVVGS